MPCAIQLLPTSCLFHTWQSIHVSATLSIRPILHTGQNGHKSKNIWIINADGWEEKGTLLPCWWECKLIQPLFLENRMEVPKETRNKTGIAQQFLSWAYTLIKTQFKKTHVLQCSLQHYLQWLKEFFGQLSIFLRLALYAFLNQDFKTSSPHPIISISDDLSSEIVSHVHPLDTICPSPSLLPSV